MKFLLVSLLFNLLIDKNMHELVLINMTIFFLLL